MRTAPLISIAVLAAGFAVAGCSKTVVHGGNDPDVVVVKEKQPGPPDHAPAHGYRRHHDRVTLVYDAHLKVYVVENHTHCYYSAGQYFRLVSGGWEWSVEIEGPWRRVKVESDIPSGLRQMDVSVKSKKQEKDKKEKQKKKDQDD